MQRFLGLVGAAGATLVLFAACGGKVVVESSGATSGGGGAGGTGETSTASMVFDGPFSAVAVGVTSGVTVGNGVTSGSGMSCVSCAQASSTLIIDESALCPEAVPLFDDLFACACAGACATQCSATACIGQATPDVCTKCLGDPGQGCGVQLKKCFSDN